MLRRRYRNIWDDQWEGIDTTGPAVQVSHGKVVIDPNAKMQTSDTGINYYINLPEGSERCMVYTQFYRLKGNSRTWKEENIELRLGMYYLIYSPNVKKYFLRQVYEGFNPDKLKKYITDKNLFIINKQQK